MKNTKTGNYLQILLLLSAFFISAHAGMAQTSGMGKEISFPSIAEMGCSGDGSTDATGCINDFLANHDVVFFPTPAVCYSVTGALQLHSNQHVLSNMAKTSATKGICQHSTTTDTFFASFATSGSRYITIEGFLLIDSVSGSRTTGASIHIDGGTGGGSGAVGINVHDNIAIGFQDGLWTQATLFSNIGPNNRWSSSLRDGWHHLGGAGGSTSTHYWSNYSDGAVGNCVLVNGLVYSVIESNACDSAGGDGYHLDDASPSTQVNRGIQLIGNGVEHVVGNGMYLDGQSIRVQGGVLTTASSGTGFSGIKWNGCISCSIGSDVYIGGNWDYGIDQARSPLHDVAIWQWTNSIDSPLPKVTGVTIAYMHDAGGITGGSINVGVNSTRAVKAISTTALSGTPTYSNTAYLPGGFGATLTASGVGVLTIDGYSTLLNDRLLVAGQASAFQDGIYCVTTQGTAGVAYVLQRCLDYTIPAQMNSSLPISVINGTVNASTLWALSTTANITVGTTNLTFVQIGGAAGGVTSFSGDGALLNNSSSTGGVTTTLATAAAHKVWMNNTGSTAAPGYQSIGTADLPAALANQTSLNGLTVTASTGTITVPNGATLTTPIHQYGASFGAPGGVALTTGGIQYFDMPQACTIIGWEISVDAGTATVKFWKIANGTAIPTVANVINTSGVAISSGTHVNSSTVSDFTSTAVAANDIGAVTITAVSGAGYIQPHVLCQ